MARVILHTKQIMDNLYPEEQLLDLHTIESIYAIRKLKALLTSNMFNGINIKTEEFKTNKSNQLFIPEFDIWFNADEYTVTKTAKEILNETFTEENIRVGWIEQSFNTILIAMEKYKNQ